MSEKYMNEKILDILSEIEKEYNVKVLLAVESGSRAWGFSSADSDWDVRFIYIHSPEYYYSLTPQPDTINLMLDERNLDFSGWDLRKALGLLMKTNPGMSDWLHSPIIYKKDEEFLTRILEEEMLFYNPLKGMYHFLSLSKKHYNRYLQKDNITLKRFLYYFRGLLACRWIDKNGAHVPVLFDDLVNATIQEEDIKTLVFDLLARKKTSREHDLDNVSPTLINYAEQIENYYQERLPKMEIEGVLGREDDLIKLLMDMIEKYYISVR